jgi:hypothetical protein
VCNTAGASRFSAIHDGDISFCQAKCSSPGFLDQFTNLLQPAIPISILTMPIKHCLFITLAMAQRNHCISHILSLQGIDSQNTQHVIFLAIPDSSLAFRVETFTERQAASSCDLAVPVTAKTKAMEGLERTYQQFLENRWVASLSD